MKELTAVDLGEHGVRVDRDSPGPILTGIFVDAFGHRVDTPRNLIALERPGVGARRRRSSERACLRSRLVAIPYSQGLAFAYAES